MVSIELMHSHQSQLAEVMDRMGAAEQRCLAGQADRPAMALLRTLEARVSELGTKTCDFANANSSVPDLQMQIDGLSLRCSELTPAAIKALQARLDEIASERPKELQSVLDELASVQKSLLHVQKSVLQQEARVEELANSVGAADAAGPKQAAPFQDSRVDTLLNRFEELALGARSSQEKLVGRIEEVAAGAAYSDARVEKLADRLLATEGTLEQAAGTLRPEICGERGSTLADPLPHASRLAALAKQVEDVAGLCGRTTEQLHATQQQLVKLQTHVHSADFIARPGASTETPMQLQAASDEQYSALREELGAELRSATTARTCGRRWRRPRASPSRRAPPALRSARGWPRCWRSWERGSNRRVRLRPECRRSGAPPPR